MLVYETIANAILVLWLYTVIKCTLNFINRTDLFIQHCCTYPCDWKQYYFQYVQMHMYKQTTHCEADYSCNQYLQML